MTMTRRTMLAASGAAVFAAATRNSYGATRPLRTVIIGTAHVHVPAFFEACTTTEGVELIGIALPNHDSPFVIPPDVKQFAQIEDLPEYDLAVVASNVDAHDVIIPKLKSKNVFVEKPLGLNAERAKSIAEVLKKGQLNSQIGYFLRRDAVLSQLRDDIKAGKLGRVTHCGLVFSHSGFSEGWLKTWPAHTHRNQQGYGTFGDLAVHLVDYASTIFGNLTPLSCQVEQEPGLDVDFQGHALLRSESGVPVQIWTSARAAKTLLEMEIVGDRGIATLRDDSLVVYTGGSEPVETKRTVTASPAEGFKTALQEFLGKSVPKGATMDEAINVNVVLDELYRLAESA